MAETGAVAQLEGSVPVPLPAADVVQLMRPAGGGFACWFIVPSNMISPDGSRPDTRFGSWAKGPEEPNIN